MTNSAIEPTYIESLIEEDKLAINDGYRAKNSELSKEGLPFARAGNINNGFQFDDADCFPVEDLDRVGHKMSQPGDVVFTSKGTVGRFAFVTEETQQFVYAPQLCFWRSQDEDLISPRWLYYWMHGKEFFSQYKGVAGQTDMAEYVSLRDQRGFKITIPPIEEQRAIASILGALDDKIELNRRMNATLESLARAIFKSWFVDFDPVKINAGEMPAGSIDPKVLDLFPSTFQDSELGPIHENDPFDAAASPTVQELMNADILDMGDGYRAKRVELADEGLPFVRAGNLHDGGFQFQNVEFLGFDGVEKAGEKKSEPFDVAFTSKGTVGRMTLVTPQTREFIYSPQVCWWRVVDSSRLNPHVLYRWMKSDEFFRQVALVKGQTDMAEYVSLRDQRAMRVNLPAARFQNLITPHLETIDATMAANRNDTRKLAKARDTLLPQLLSGELPVPEALTATEEVLV